jgi:serine protease Do
LHQALRTGLLLAAVAAWTLLWSGGLRSSAQEPAGATGAQGPAATTSVADLREVEKRLARVLSASQAATVHVQIEGASGSGVVVSSDGYVLTAAHVSGAPERPAVVTFPDGRRVRGVTLGRLNYHFNADAGLIQITAPGGPWPAVEMGRSAQVQAGDWCFALGYPGGYDEQRGPVLRIGRIIHGRAKRFWTDCVLLGGDSGGPLFDLDGRVIGVHSAIARPTELNFHAPVDAFRKHWSALAHGHPLLGVSTTDHGRGALVQVVAADSAAAQIGLQVGDIIASLDGAPVLGPQTLRDLILSRKPGESVTLQVMRADQTLELQADLGRTWAVLQSLEVGDE